ncbi:hypothetical protein V6N13_120284 [Hibiscus sabdariffa]|uniref:Uncharacterized protein n=1 Tax=Hibiscus sabdariffa TaxID=183260 RepID=A0ABR2E3T5_9ROSI
MGVCPVLRAGAGGFWGCESCPAGLVLKTSSRWILVQLNYKVIAPEVFSNNRNGVINRRTIYYIVRSTRKAWNDEINAQAGKYGPWLRANPKGKKDRGDTSLGGHSNVSAIKTSDTAAKIIVPDIGGYDGNSQNKIISNPMALSNNEINSKMAAKSLNVADMRISKSLEIRDVVPPSSNSLQETLALSTESNKKVLAKNA